MKNTKYLLQLIYLKLFKLVFFHVIEIPIASQAPTQGEQYYVFFRLFFQSLATVLREIYILTLRNNIISGKCKSCCERLDVRAPCASSSCCHVFAFAFACKLSKHAYLHTE